MESNIKVILGFQQKNDLKYTLNILRDLGHCGDSVWRNGPSLKEKIPS